MMVEGRREHWEQAHEGKDETQLSWYQPTPATSIKLIESAGISKDARIIDVGGGTSRLVDLLIERDYSNITVLDLAEHAPELTRQRLPQDARSRVKWIQADVTEWEPDGTYDLWHDRAVFHFLTAEQDREAYKQRLRKGLKPGGHLIIGTFALDGPERCSGLPVRRYSPESLAAELGREFELIESAGEEHRTPHDVVQRFQFSRFIRR